MSRAQNIIHNTHSTQSNPRTHCFGFGRPHKPGFLWWWSVWNACLRISRGMWCLWHAGALAWRRGPVCACTRVCWCRRIFTDTYIHRAANKDIGRDSWLWRCLRSVVGAFVSSLRRVSAAQYYNAQRPTAKNGNNFLNINKSIINQLYIICEIWFLKFMFLKFA